MTLWTRGFETVPVQYALSTGLVWLGLLVERRTIESVRRWPLWLDFGILLKTIPVAVFNSGKAA